MHGKCVRQRNVRQDNIMDRAGILPLNLYENDTVLKPVNVNLLIGVERVPRENDEPSCLIQMRTPVYQSLLDSFSDSDSDSAEEVDGAPERTMGMMLPTRLGRVRTLTSRMAYFLQVGMTEM